MRTIGIFGYCQAQGIAECLAFMCPDIGVVTGNFARLTRRGKSVDRAMAECDVVFAQPADIAFNREVRKIPALLFRGFQPDGVPAYKDGTTVKFERTGALTSAIALYAWSNGASLPQTKRLFRPEVFEAIGYCDMWERDVKLLSATSAAADFPLAPLIAGWLRHPPFMHVLYHPKLHVLADIAREIARSLELRTDPKRAEDFVPDRLMRRNQWPVYPGIADQFGLEGGYSFRIAPSDGAGRHIDYDLDGFLEQCFADYAAFQPESLHCDVFDNPRFRALDRFLEAGRPHLHFTPKADDDAYAAAANVICDEELLDPL